MEGANKNEEAYDKQFRRDINRISDSDRNTRKRGLQKLLEELPWQGKLGKKSFRQYLTSAVLPPVLVALSDSVEKCREISIEILKKMVELYPASVTSSEEAFLQSLCARFNEVPFPEPTEELRLQLVNLLISHFGTREEDQCPRPIVDGVIQAMPKVLQDNFPLVKRSAAELLCLFAAKWPLAIRMAFPSLLKGLGSNLQHQHSKTRMVTLKALGQCLSTVVDGYEKLMEETVLQLFFRALSDLHAANRRQLAASISTVLNSRFRSQIIAVDADLEMLALLIVLLGDDVEDVRSEALAELRSINESWKVFDNNKKASLLGDEAVEDAERALHLANSSLGAMDVEVPSSESTVTPANDSNDAMQSGKPLEVLSMNASRLVAALLSGVDTWTVETRRSYLKATRVFIELIGPAIQTHLPQILQSLSSPIRDEDISIRQAAEESVEALGRVSSADALLDLLLPKANGITPGGDTASQRTYAIRLLTHSLRGLADSPDQEDGGINKAVDGATDILSHTELYEFREAYLREALVLLIRCVLQCFPRMCRSRNYQERICLGVLYLMGKLSGEDELIGVAAKKELLRLHATCQQDLTPQTTNSAIAAFVQEFMNSASDVGDSASIHQIPTKHFMYLFQHIVPTANPSWSPSSAGRTAFGVLLHICYKEAWNHHGLIVPVIAVQVQPKKQLDPDSAEAHSLSYAAVRGEETIPQVGEVDVRLTLLALLEGWIRLGTADWECGRQISEACEAIVGDIITPNLVWRVGRVEATIRKVALAACYGLLKAGAVANETLFRTAPKLVPLITSHLDDHDVSPRLMACLSLRVIFERLRGGFGDQAVHELYPKLLKRLDDSDDTVRLAICGTLEKFLVCASPSCYKGTLIDYTLDQLFIHLDDPNPTMQEAVLSVLVNAAALVSKPLVLKKAEENRESHRTPDMCDRVIRDVQGFEILDANS